MKKYNPLSIEKKWQKIWEKKGAFRAQDGSKRPKFYALVEFPYPSGEGLHVGHCRSYVGMDIICRKKRMEGFNVLFPMGWDAFGLPTENYAIKTGIHPAIATKKNTANFKRQEKSLGLSFDWSREIDTTDPNYYKWTQWIFIQLFKNGFAYKAKMPINWCLSCKIGLANEEVVNGKCERCGGNVEKREKEQWLLKITKYADRLLEDLDKVDYTEKIKTQQINWIGRSEGAEIDFPLTGSDLNLKVFTTRPDTLFGCTFMVVAPENEIINRLKDKIENWNEVQKYITQTKKKSDLERTELNKEKTGAELKGVKAVNPANNKEIPIFVADYVMLGYGTGAIMAVPAHDQRDFEFAKKYDLPVVKVVESSEKSDEVFVGDGIVVNSGEFNGLKTSEFKEKITRWLEEKGFGKRAVNYKLRDWIFSRQRYWGEPIPLIFCKDCKKLAVNSKFQIPNSKQIPNPKSKIQNFNTGELQNPGWVAVSEKNLPVKLPAVKNYKPTETGESPLATAKNWLNIKCPKCGTPAERETDVMPNWAGSNWYYLAYLMRGISNFHGRKADSPKGCFPISKYKKAFKYWMPVDWYNGGMEHTTLHLLYSRFIYKFLWDIGAAPKAAGPEPYKKRTSHGIILGEGGIKMSKSKGNVVNPDDVVKQYGADAMRIYEMFMGPFDQMIPWDSKGAVGARRFLQKVWELFENPKSKILAGQENPKLENLLHRTIKKISEDIENLKFNTAVSALMILTNELTEQKEISSFIYSQFLMLLCPFAPHLSEELWQRAGFKGFCYSQKWPKYDSKLIKDEKITLVVQIDGKVRDKIEIDAGADEEKAKEAALSSEKTKKWIGNQEIKRAIFIKDKLLNLLTK